LNNVAQRTLSGVILIAAVSGALIFSQFTYILLFLVILTAGLLEFFQMMAYKDLRPHTEFGIVIGIFLFISSYLQAKNIMDEKIYILTIPIFAGLFISEIYRKEKHPFDNLGNTFLGIIYIAIPISLVNYLVIKGGQHDYYPYIVLGIMALLWTYDTIAYIIGYLAGKNPLFSRISPRKTWEGVMGGSVFTFLAAWGISSIEQSIQTIDWLVIALIIIVFGTFGDLLESLLKRQVGLKDSGKLLPGHGGVLDRFDSLLFSIPIIFTYLEFVNTSGIF